MDTDPPSHHSEPTSDPDLTPEDASQKAGVSEDPTGKKRSASPTNDDPSKRLKTSHDSAEPSSDNEQLGNENETTGVSVASEAPGAPSVAPTSQNVPKHPSSIRLPSWFPPIPQAAMQELKVWLATHANARAGDQIASGSHTQLLKTMEPYQQDLEAICRTMRVETNGIDWRDGVTIPEVTTDRQKVKAHQISGANWISNTLDSPLRAALLADECGTGKTVQIGLALAMHYHRVKAEVEAGTFRPRDDMRWFKPSIILCPHNLAYQTFREWSSWFPKFFEIQICHGTKAQAVDESAEEHTMNEKDGLQSWVDENAASHRDIDTLLNIAIIPYNTALERMIDREEMKKQKAANQTQLQQLLKSKRKKRPNVENEELKFSIKGQSYNWIICDDVYAIRGPRTETHQLITELEHEATLIASATPLLNHQDDMKKAWQALQNGDEYKGLTLDHIIQPERSTLGKATFRDRRMREEYITYIQEKKGPLFLMNPDLFQEFREDMKSKKPEVAREAIRPLLEMFCLRRGMLSHTAMPDGTTVVPSEGIPRMHIRTVNVQPYNDEDQNDLYRIIKKHYPKLFNNSRDKGKDIGHGTFDKAQHMWPNSAIVRTLALSTTNVESYPLTQKPSGEDNKYSPSALNSPIGQKVMKNQPCLDRLTSLNLPEANTATIETKDPEKIDKILAKDGVGGLLWYLSEMHQDQNVEFPEYRQDIVKTICARSPKLCWTVKRVLELKEDGHRVLVFVDNPSTSLIVAALLTSVCVTTLNIRSSNKPHERAQMVRKFNDPDEKFDALVVSFELGGFGMNLQGACHHGIVVEYPDNIPTMLHGFGRLWRLGQEREVHWDVLYMENSFDGWDETWMVSKYADILAAEGEIPDEIQGEHRVICAFELIKRYLGQDSNRYPRTRVTWAEQEHPLVAREGHFYSALATYLLQNPGHFKEVCLKPLPLIARRWSPEQGELTLDMIEGNSPELEDGVILDSRNPLKPGYVAVSADGDLHLRQEFRQAAEILSNLKDDGPRLRIERDRRI
ncbi:uncharacterized protein FTJAE_11682 [Fusarium tjaetaba]|uniref:Helicase C-terminal domain-containing protein n=1 Tax=Fusarium tjaetaba TaxID=1567544 RepID=A0A8H5QS85_9HYPO|nr:uncharacterized protein FTJAE_11682 [Fusarium tjaetaba]KAF5620325.1 hypothetical protein FTJAE_11682 [Fusarium tjaetaba]